MSGKKQTNKQIPKTTTPLISLPVLITIYLSLFNLDINECNSTMEVCQQTCINTNGSYYCQCREEYELNDDNSTCSGKLSLIPSYLGYNFLNTISVNSCSIYFIKINEFHWMYISIQI